MDSMDIKVLKSGFAAVNENLVDIAKSLRSMREPTKKDHWYTIEKDGYPGPEYEWVLVIVSYNNIADNVPIVAKYDQKRSCWVVHCADGYADVPLGNDCKVVRWLPIFGDSSDILYAGGKELGRVHRYGVG